MVTLGAMLYTHDMKGIEHEVNEDVLNEMPTSLALFGAAQGSIDEEKTSFASLLKDRVCAKICAFCFAPSPPGPWCEQCSMHACSQCKVTAGRDWTYTIFQPLATAAMGPV